jgi:MFS family permease
LFLVNVPIGIAAVVAAGRGVAESRAVDPDPLDPVGLATLTAGLGLVLVPLTLGRDEGWPLWTVLMLGAGAVMLAGFGTWEARLARTGGRPIVPPAVLRSREVVGGLAVSVGFFVFFGSFMLAMTIFLQDGQDRSPLNAGLVYGPLGLAFAVSSLAARRLVEVHGARVLTAGTSLSAVSLAGVTALVAIEGVEVATAELVPLLMLIGVGNGLVIPALVAAVLATAPPDVSGAVGGVLATTQQFASALGVAGIGAVFFAEAARGGPAAGMQAALLCDLVAVGVAVAGTFALPRGVRVVRLQHLDGDAREVGAQRAE